VIKMARNFERRPLAELTKELALAAQGHVKADLAVRGGKLVNVHTAEVYPADVAVKYGRVVAVGDVDHVVGPNTEVIDATGYYVSPGFLESHVHIESSMVTPTQFCRAVVPHGTTGVFIDNHEIANVLGLAGIRLMLEESRGLPLKVYLTVPSCVPALPGFDDAGAEISPGDIEEALKWKEVAALGEMMNMPGVVTGEPRVHTMLRATLESGKVVTGHWANPDVGPALQAYVAAGISSDHESTRKEEAIAKLRLGMWVQFREGSAWKDLAETIRAITEEGLDPRHALLVADDVHADTLVSQGHLDHILRRAIEEGVDPVRTIQMITLNVAEYFRMAHEIGSVAPGRMADMVLFKELREPYVEKVIVDGVLVASDGRWLVELPSFIYPDFALRSVRLRAPLRPEDFVIRAPVHSGAVKVRVIRAVEAKATTLYTEMELPVVDGELRALSELDVAKLAVVERHKATGQIGLGLVTGFGLKAGAMASTVAHDSHNLLVMGMNDSDMAMAANVLAERGGGMVAVRDGQVLALVPLPVAGLMSTETVEVVDQQIRALDRAWQELGCRIVSPFMTMSLLSLPVIPELRLTDRGLVDVREVRQVDLVVR
jgi:adenine deaminase